MSLYCVSLWIVYIVRWFSALCMSSTVCIYSYNVSGPYVTTACHICWNWLWRRRNIFLNRSQYAHICTYSQKSQTLQRVKLCLYLCHTSVKLAGVAKCCLRAHLFTVKQFEQKEKWLFDREKQNKEVFEVAPTLCWLLHRPTLLLELGVGWSIIY